MKKRPSLVSPTMMRKKEAYRKNYLESSRRMKTGMGMSGTKIESW